jgi:NADH dehydrogenase
MSVNNRPRILIVGGGFAGLEAAKALAGVAADVILVDRRNHHVFQPLLYQVATASLSPADISSPIRRILRGQTNCQVVLAEVTGIDVESRKLLTADGAVPFDYLILAAGATHSYFGRDEWAALAPGLKSLEDATELRRRILMAFESAEYESNEEARRAALTFAIVGGGPTGVELAGAIKEIAGRTIPQDYQHIDTRTTRVILIEGQARLIAAFPEKLSRRAQQDLERMGVEVRLNSLVTEITAHGLKIHDEFLPVHNVFWAAGVRASPLGSSLNVTLDRSGRVIVGPDLAIPSDPHIFVIGDMAAARSGEDNTPIPGLAPAAMQMGSYVGRVIAAEIQQSPTPERTPFIYKDKGSLAVIGKAKAVAAIGRWQLTGIVAWLVWAFVHIMFLIGFRNRLKVMFNWFWNWLINARDARLITGPVTHKINIPGTTQRLYSSHDNRDLSVASKQLPRSETK